MGGAHESIRFGTRRPVVQIHSLRPFFIFRTFEDEKMRSNGFLYVGAKFTPSVAQFKSMDSRRPNTNKWDATLVKTLAISELKKLEFRWEASNLFNHPQFVQVPNSDVLNAPPG